LVALLIVVAVLGWIAVLVLARELRHARALLASARRDVEAAEDDDDRVAHAEAVRHWLQAALDESTDAVVVVDRIGREIVRNAVARRFAGSRTGEVLAEDALAELLQHALDGHTSERELQLYGPPRQVLQLRVFPLRRDGEVVGAVGFTRDISESRRVESVRRDFVANVSHELKTPIGALLLIAETMVAADEPEVMRRFAEKMLTEAERLARIVDDLLDLSTIESQEAPIREPMPLRLLVAECVDLVQASAIAAHVPLRIEPEPPAIHLVCDARQLRSAILNLLDNAIKYSGPGDAVEIGASVEADRVAITVRDHGIGIPRRDLERIFERFYRVDRARSRDTGGTGLGLSIVRHVAQAHSGEVTVDSREGEGSAFTLYIPTATTTTTPLRSFSEAH
jgi:two-component system sensor histidine kinase SenX3